MPIEIKMPALSPTMTEGNLAKWLKREGDEVAPGDVIAEIETDKATMEVEAVDEGRMGKIVVDEGTEGVAVNALIALLLEEGEDADALKGFSSDTPSESKAPPADGRAGAGAPSTTPAASEPAPRPKPKPLANGKADDGRHGGRIFASPLARRMAEQAGLDLALIQGSGPHGRIVKADVLKPDVLKPDVLNADTLETKAGGGAQASASAAAADRPGTMPAPVMPAPAPGGHDEVPLSQMRKVIAKRITEAKQTVPHFYLTIDCALDPLLDLRAQINGRDGAEQKISVNDFVIKASALALKKVPDANASFAGDKIIRYHDVDISVAVAIPDGLITPIVRQADQKGLGLIGTEMKDLAARAKAGKLKPEEFQGGGFSISNLGMFGIREFAAIINPPQACILAVGAGEKRPVIDGKGKVKAATMMTCTLSVDHRVVDGALGATFLQAFKGYIEQPLGMLI